MMGSVDEDRIPSSTRIWRAERAKKRTIPLVLSAAAGRRSGERGHCLHIGRIVVLQLWHSLIRPADGRALSGAARGMLKLLLLYPQANLRVETKS